jgi:predicted transcriptional regulator
MEWFEKCLERSCTVFNFPPNRQPNVRVLSPGSVCLVLVKEGSSRKDWLFVGEFTVKSVKLVKGEEFSAYAPRAVELPTVQFPKPGENSWIIEFDNIVKYERPVKLGDFTDIMVKSKPLSEQRISGFTPLKPDVAPQIINAIRNKAGYKPTPPPPKPAIEASPSHDDLVKELLELGEWLGFYVEKEKWTDDMLYRVDVAWMRSPGKPPIKVFEVEISHDVDRALARLKHAYDTWNCQQLWLIVSDEAKAERAWKLVEPRLKGAFEEIRGRVTVVGWKEVHELYTGINPYKDVLKELLKR